MMELNIQHTGDCVRQQKNQVGADLRPHCTCGATRQARLTLKQVVEMFDEAKAQWRDGSQCLDRFMDVLEQLRKEAEGR